MVVNLHTKNSSASGHESRLPPMLWWWGGIVCLHELWSVNQTNHWSFSDSLYTTCIIKLMMCRICSPTSDKGFHCKAHLHVCGCNGTMYYNLDLYFRKVHLYYNLFSLRNLTQTVTPLNYCVKVNSVFLWCLFIY